MRWTLVIKAAFPEEKIAYDLIVWARAMPNYIIHDMSRSTSKER